MILHEFAEAGQLYGAAATHIYDFYDTPSKHSLFENMRMLIVSLYRNEPLC